MTKYRPESILLISAFALALTLRSPAFAQCYGGRCYTQPAAQAAPAQAPQPTVRVVYPCQTAQACRPCQQSTFAPFGGFFRNLFGFGWQASSCGRCTAQTRAGGFFDSVSDRSGGVCQPCQAEAPAACSACDSCEECPVEETETYEATEAETDADACSACEPVAPCGNVEDLTEIEAELIRLANAERGAVRCTLLSPDKNLFGWARLNSRLQASYCRTGHFSGAGWEISGGGYRSAAGVIKGWIDSAPHKAILLRNGFTKAGASVYQGRDGRFYWTMVFGN